MTSDWWDIVLLNVPERTMMVKLPEASHLLFFLDQPRRRSGQALQTRYALGSSSKVSPRPGDCAERRSELNRKRFGSGIINVLQ